MLRPPPRPTLFPYTTLFRSRRRGDLRPLDEEDELALYRFAIDTLEATGFEQDRKSTRLNSSHVAISYAVFCLKKKRTMNGRLPSAGTSSRERTFAFLPSAAS